MDAPQISTLEPKEDSPQPANPQPPPSAPAPGPSSMASSRPNQSGRVPIYVDDEEEDQLIDDDDDVAGPSARPAPVAAAEHPRTALPERLTTQPSRQQLTPTPSVVSVGSEPSVTYIPPPGPSASSQSGTPRKRPATKPRKADEPISIVTSPVGSAAPTKKKRNRTAIKATLEVGRQEPETHDNTGTTSAWRLDGGSSTAVPPMQMTMVHQDEMSMMNPSAAKPPAKRKRAPKTAAAVPVDAPPNEGSSMAPPPKKRQRTTQPKKSLPIQDEGTPDFYPAAAYQDLTPDIGSSTPNEYFATGPPTHVDQFRIPEGGIQDVPDDALAGAPLRPVPHFTNTVSPGSFIPWQSYAGPLEKKGKKCRRWTPVQRSIKTIGGGVWFAKTWLGGETSEIEHVKPPLVVEPPLHLLEGPALSVASESEKPTKLPRSNKPRERKTKVKAEGGSASATATPPTHASTPIPDVAAIEPPHLGANVP